jgi:hypothetical protein
MDSDAYMLNIQGVEMTTFTVANLQVTFLIFVLQENPFQRAARQQNRSGSVSSSSTLGDGSDSISSNTGIVSNAALPSTSQEYTAVAAGGIPCFCVVYDLCGIWFCYMLKVYYYDRSLILSSLHNVCYDIYCCYINITDLKLYSYLSD